ncbi:hypothetical protein [Mycobacterium gordonae]|uniref:hypothetical protein n=1 Tax=Mycobacterium gordonae TaxID=1778 RepID=UPI001151EAAE|nr:hypothetical protein [Mycobacterium gordonae]MCV7008581.1 hypothetical protein [Mycobacterium gordonae]
MTAPGNYGLDGYELSAAEMDELKWATFSYEFAFDRYTQLRKLEPDGEFDGKPQGKAAFRRVRATQDELEQLKQRIRDQRRVSPPKAEVKPDQMPDCDPVDDYAKYADDVTGRADRDAPEASGIIGNAVRQLTSMAAMDGMPGSVG